MGLITLPINPGVTMLARMVLRIIERKSMGKQTRYFIKVLSTIRIDVYRSARIKTCVILIYLDQIETAYKVIADIPQNLEI